MFSHLVAFGCRSIAECAWAQASHEVCGEDFLELPYIWPFRRDNHRDLWLCYCGSTLDGTSEPIQRRRRHHRVFLLRFLSSSTASRKVVNAAGTSSALNAVYALRHSFMYVRITNPGPSEPRVKGIDARYQFQPYAQPSARSGRWQSVHFFVVDEVIHRCRLRRVGIEAYSSPPTESRKSGPRSRGRLTTITENRPRRVSRFLVGG